MPISCCCHQNSPQQTDEHLSASENNKSPDLPTLSFIFHKPKPVGTEFKVSIVEYFVAFCHPSLICFSHHVLPFLLATACSKAKVPNGTCETSAAWGQPHDK
jgi:hypothetical protein